jgi:hypothetical protein
MTPLDSLFAALGHTLWTASLQAGVLALLALLAERIFRNAPPSFRYWLWMLVVIRLAVPVDFAVPFGIREYIKNGLTALFAPSPYQVEYPSPDSNPRPLYSMPEREAEPEDISGREDMPMPTPRHIVTLRPDGLDLALVQEFPKKWQTKKKIAAEAINLHQRGVMDGGGHGIVESAVRTTRGPAR